MSEKSRLAGSKEPLRRLSTFVDLHPQTNVLFHAEERRNSVEYLGSGGGSSGEVGSAGGCRRGTVYLGKRLELGNRGRLGNVRETKRWKLEGNAAPGGGRG